MFSKIIGGTLLIVGTSIGAGMLALPVATASGGFYHSLLLFFGAWVTTVIGAFFILEVNLWLPENTNLVSMAKKTLGPFGQIITWFSYLLLLYSLLSAYTAGGTDLLHNLFNTFHIYTPNWLDSLLFVLLLGAIVHNGVRVVDMANRGLMFIKMGAFFLLVMLVLNHADFPKLVGGDIKLLSGALMVVITSFGYASIIPSLRYYFNSNVKALRLTIALGSITSLIIYILWDLAVQSTVQTTGPGGLLHMGSSGHAASELTIALSKIAQSSLINDMAHLFTAICITTSFIGVALCLKDFLTDGFGVEKSKSGKWLATATTFIPPLAIILFYPGVFIIGLNYAGIFCVILLMLLPALMAWSGRYIKKVSADSIYEVWGGRSIVAIEILLSFALVIYACLQLR